MAAAVGSMCWWRRATPVWVDNPCVDCQGVCVLDMYLWVRVYVPCVVDVYLCTVLQGVHRAPWG